MHYSAYDGGGVSGMVEIAVTEGFVGGRVERVLGVKEVSARSFGGGLVVDWVRGCAHRSSAQ